MMPVKHPFSTFAPENTPLLQENQYNYIRFDSLNPPFHYPRTHDSNIPEFHHSNWGEAPNLSFRLQTIRLLDIDQYLKNQGHLDFLSDSIPYGESNPAKKNIIIN